MLTLLCPSPAPPQFIKVDIDAEALAASVAAARVSAVVRFPRRKRRGCVRSPRAPFAPAQPTFAFHKDGKPIGEIRGADAAGVRAAVAELKHS